MLDPELHRSARRKLRPLSAERYSMSIFVKDLARAGNLVSFCLLFTLVGAQAAYGQGSARTLRPAPRPRLTLSAVKNGPYQSQSSQGCTFSVSPPSLFFGSVPVGGRASLGLTITPAQIIGSASYAITSSNPAFSASPANIPASTSAQNVTVTFSPNAVGNFAGNINIGSSCSGGLYSGSGNVPVSGTGVASFTVSPDPLDFGAVQLGCPSTAGLRVSSSSSLSFSISASPSAFRVSPSSFIGSRVVGVTFTPSALGFTDGSAMVMASSDGVPIGSRTTSLTGFGLDVVVSPTSLDFGSVPVGTTSASQSFQMRTNPATNASFDGIRVDSDSPAFSSSSLSASGVGQIRFTPPSPGPFSGAISATLGLDSSPNCFFTRGLSVTGVGVVQGSITAAPGTLDFSAKAGAPLREQRIVSITSPELANLQWATAVTGGTPRWLRLSPAAGGVPGYFVVTVDTTGLGPGTQQAEIVVTGRPATPSAAVLPDGFGDAAQSFPTARVIARLTIVDQPPSLSVGPPVLSLVGFEGLNSVLRQSLAINNTGGGSLQWTAQVETTGNRNFLSLSAASGTAPSSVVVTADLSGLAAGVYQGRIRVFSGSQEVDIPMTLLVSRAGPLLTLDRTGLVFETVQGTGALPAQRLRVLNTGLGTVNWTADIFAPNNPGWLSLSPASGSSDGAKLGASPQVGVSANVSGLQAGIYSALLRIQSPQALNGPQFATVILNVMPAGSTPPVALNPDGLAFSGSAGGAQPAAQSLDVRIHSPQPVSFAASATTFSGGNWLSVGTASGSASSTQSSQIQIRANTTGLVPGSYQGQIGVSLADGTHRGANVLLVVTPAGALATKAPGSGVDAGLPGVGACSPAYLTVLHTVLAFNFSVRAHWPTPIEVLVKDNCDTPVEEALVITTFSNELRVMRWLGDGRYSATWETPASASGENVRTTASAGPLSGETVVVGTVNTNANAFPTVPQNGVVHAATFNASALAPGVIFSVFGQNFATSTSQARTLPLPTNLSGASVLVAGREGPLYFANNGQINAQLPYEIPAGSQARLVVRAGSLYSVVDPPLTIASAQPGIFLLDAVGNRAAAQNQDSSLNTRANPVARGGVVIIYFAGLGAVSPGVETGAAAPSAEPFAQSVLSPEATIGGRAARILFIGLTPGLAGLAQAALEVPTDVPPGDATVVLTIADQASNAPLISVK